VGRRVVLSIAFAVVVLPACGTARQREGDGAAVRTPPRSSFQRRHGPNGDRGVALKRVGNFESPTYVAGAPGYPKLLFVVEQPGRVEVMRAGRKLRHPFLDIRDLVGYDGGERGLLSIAFPPDYL
jgi:hypothetical protein